MRRVASSGPERDVARLWREPALGDTELLHAHYRVQTFAPHTHDGYALGVIERGAQRFHYRGAWHVADQGSLVAIHPGEVHTGQPVAEVGWRYRMLYPDAERLRDVARELGHGGELAFFASPVMHDPPLAEQLRALHARAEASSQTGALRCDDLAIETEMAEFLARMIARHARREPAIRAVRHERRIVRAVREYIHAHHRRNIRLAELSEIAGLSPFHLVRVFRATAGLPPHAYLGQVRIDRARALLGDGVPVAHVAREVGFADQSHLTRKFRRIVGVPPAAYQRGVRG